MNTKELALLANAAPPAPNGAPLRCVCLDEGVVFNAAFSIGLVDANGSVVTTDRLQTLQRTPLDQAEYLAVYNDPDDFWAREYPTFEAFYQFMENARLAEVKLIDEAESVAIVRPSVVQL